MSACPCEDQQQSAYSPRVVSDAERVIYCLIDPDDIDEASETLKKKAFSKSKVTLRQGPPALTEDVTAICPYGRR